MSSILDIATAKEKCQKFTPPNFVNTALDMADYIDGVVGKKILENSFGSGNFLIQIVKRYIRDGFAQRLSSEEISEKMSSDIMGVELDVDLFNRTIKELNSVIEEESLPPVKWSLFNADFLVHSFECLFDFIIGNPPYLSYKDLDLDNRKYIRDTFTTCKVGKFDYCYAFIEKSIGLLSPSGCLVQLVPGNIYKNVYANTLRTMMLEHISAIWEYPQKKVFEETLTSSSLFKYDNANNSEFVEYKNITENMTVKIPRHNLNGKWVFSLEEEELPQESVKRFGDYYRASAAVATLLNEAFVIDDKTAETLETQVVRPATSPKSIRNGKSEFIIFPYYYRDGKLFHYESDEFEKEYPCTTRHLNGYKENLNTRKKDKSAKWFEYGRSQALAHLNQRKMLLSTVITSKVELNILDPNTVPYSGIYIVALDNNHTLEYAKNLLESERFMRYIRGLGVNVSGKSKRITCEDINNYCFVEEG